LKIKRAYCYLLSNIGQSIANPQLFEVKVRLRDASQLDALRPQIQAVAQETFSQIDAIWHEAIDGTLQLW